MGSGNCQTPSHDRVVGSAKTQKVHTFEGCAKLTSMPTFASGNAVFCHPLDPGIDRRGLREMSAPYPSWLGAAAAAVTMLDLGMRTRMLARPELNTRCAACGRLFFRRRICPCSRDN